MSRPSVLPSPIASAQLAAVLVAVPAMMMWPPARGRMLLVPVAASAGGMANRALATGARIVAAGPLPGSMVVVSHHPGLRRTMIAHGVLPLSAEGGCGTFIGKLT